MYLIESLSWVCYAFVNYERDGISLVEFSSTSSDCMNIVALLLLFGCGAGRSFMCCCSKR